MELCKMKTRNHPIRMVECLISTVDDLFGIQLFSCLMLFNVKSKLFRYDSYKSTSETIPQYSEQAAINGTEICVFFLLLHFVRLFSFSVFRLYLSAKKQKFTKRICCCDVCIRCSNWLSFVLCSERDCKKEKTLADTTWFLFFFLLRRKQCCFSEETILMNAKRKMRIFFSLLLLTNHFLCFFWSIHVRKC